MKRIALFLFLCFISIGLSFGSQKTYTYSETGMSVAGNSTNTTHFASAGTIPTSAPTFAQLIANNPSGTATCITNLQTININYCRLDTTTGQSEPFARFNMTLNYTLHPIDTINWIFINFTGLSTGNTEACDVGYLRFSDSSKQSMGTWASGGIIGSVTLNVTSNFANYNSSAGQIIPYVSGTNHDSGEYCGADYVYITVDYTLDSTPPTVTYVAPTPNNANLTGNTWAYINVTSVDTTSNIDSCLLGWNGGANVSMTKVGTGTSVSCWYNKTGLITGNYNYIVYSNDTKKNMGNSGSRTITIDATNPTISYNADSTGSGSYKQDWVLVNITCSDTYKDTVVFNWNGVNETFNNNVGDVYWENKTGLGDGTYTHYAWCNDTVGHSNGLAQRSVTLDNNAPAITYIPPTLANATPTDKDWVYVNITSIDSLTNIDSCILEWEGTTNYSMTKVGSGTSVSCWYNVTSLPSEAYTYKVYSNDTLNNMQVAEERTVYVDVTNPLISYNPSSLDNGNYVQDWIFINISCTDNMERDTVIFNWDGANESFDNNDGNGNFWENKTSLPGGTYTHYAWCNDTVGHTNQTLERTINLDYTAPTVTYTSPTPPNLNLTGDDWVYINVTSVDTLNNIDTCLLEWGASNTSMNEVGSGSSVSCWYNITGLSSGTYNYKVYSNDSFGNMGSESQRQVEIDRTKPTMNWNPSTDEGLLGQSWILVNITCSDTHKDSVIFEWDGANESFDNNAGDIYWENKTGLAEGTYDFNAYCNDTVGNIENLTEKSATLDLTNPSISYNPTTTNTGMYSQDWIFINITCSDSNKDTIILNWEGVNESFDSSSGDEYWENKTTLSDGDYSFYAVCNDSLGHYNQTAQKDVTLDTTPSTYYFDSDDSSGSVSVGTIVNIYSFWNDTEGVDTATIRNNISGFWSEVDYCNIGSTEGWCNDTIDTTGHTGERLCWNEYANDTMNNLNNTMSEHCFDVTGLASYISVTQDSPTNTSYITTSTIWFNATTNDTASFCQYQLDNNANVTMDGSGTSWSKSNSVNDGFHNSTIFCNSTTNNWAVSDIVYFTVDVNPPTIDIISPTNNTNYSTSTIWFNATASESVNTWIVNYNGTNVTIPINTSLSVEDGSFHLLMYANDTYNHWGLNDSIYFNVDSHNPSISYNPTTTDSGSYIQDWIFINVTCSDLNKDSVVLIVDGINETFDNQNNNIYWENKTGLAEGNHTISAYCNDTYGHSNSTSEKSYYLDYIYPTYFFDSDDSGGSVLAGTNVEISVYWNDTLNMSLGMYYHNQTGSFVLNDTCDFTGLNASWCNKTFDTTGHTGERLCWNEYANDTMNNLNNTMSEHCFDVVASNPPIVILSLPSNDTVFDNATEINLSFTATDDSSATLDCDLYINNILTATNSSVNNGTLTTFNLTANETDEGHSEWKVTCSDGESSNTSDTSWFWNIIYGLFGGEPATEEDLTIWYVMFMTIFSIVVGIIGFHYGDIFMGTFSGFMLMVMAMAVQMNSTTFGTMTTPLTIIISLFGLSYLILMFINFKDYVGRLMKKD